jgi:hypothetical protein
LASLVVQPAALRGGTEDSLEFLQNALPARCCSPALHAGAPWHGTHCRAPNLPLSACARGSMDRHDEQWGGSDPHLRRGARRVLQLNDDVPRYRVKCSFHIVVGLPPPRRPPRRSVYQPKHAPVTGHTYIQVVGIHQRPTLRSPCTPQGRMTRGQRAAATNFSTGFEEVQPEFVRQRLAL